MFKRALFILFYLLSLQTVTHAYADEEELPEYDVEVIVFEDAHARYINSEDWAAENETIEPNQPESSPDNTGTYTNIPANILTRPYKHLLNSSEFNVLYRAAWRQQGLDESKAFNIKLSELRNLHKSTSKNKVDGTFRVELARYLHFYADLYYRRPIPLTQTADEPENKPSTAPASQLPPGKFNTEEPVDDNQASYDIPGYTTYPLHEHERMRSKELHYIDHPLIGILVKIMPVEKKEKADSSE